MISSTQTYKRRSKFSHNGIKLIKPDKFGRIYIPAFYRRIIGDAHLFPYMENGELRFAIVKVEDDFKEVDEHEGD
ncbi:hypothetical protein [Archaeoglobus sp.]